MNKLHNKAVYRYELLALNKDNKSISLWFDCKHDAIYAGLQLISGFEINNIEITEIEYSGDCRILKKIPITEEVQGE